LFVIISFVGDLLPVTGGGWVKMEITPMQAIAYNSSRNEVSWVRFQGFFEVLFVLVAMACVPVMLFAKPYLLLKEHRLEAMRGVAQLVRPIFYLFQGLAQSVLLLMAVVCVPVMLFAKPVCLHIRQRHNDDAQRLVVFLVLAIISGIVLFQI
jgi:hypothetical protein